MLNTIPDHDRSIDGQTAIRR